MFRKPFKIVLIGLLAILAVACQPETVEVPVEVTRVVTEQVEGEVVEVTRVIENQIEVVSEVEVTRVIEVPPPDAPEGELIVAITTFPNAITPPNAAERQASNVTLQMFNGLVWRNEAGEIEPALATSWEISDDGTTYTFTLREGVVFHNGETFDAEDVVTTWEAGKDPLNAYYYTYEDVVAIEVIDDYTVAITSSAPDPLFLTTGFPTFGIYPTDYYNEVGFEGFEAHPIGTGAFQFVEWIEGERIVLEANPNYWEEGLPKLARVVFRPIPESATRLAAIQTGEIHIASRLIAEEASQLLTNRDIQVISYSNDRSYYIAFNNLTSGIGQPTEDVRVRLAMNYAVDRQAIIDALFDGQATLSSGFVAPFNLGFDSSIEPYPYDPDQAIALLTDAGYPDGFEIGFACPIGAYPNFEQVCEAVAGYLAEVGITPEGGEIQFMESGQYWDLEANKELPALFGDAWSVTNGEALDRLQGALLAEASYAAWEDAELRALIEEASATIDIDARADVYTRIHQYMYENPPFIYLYYPNVFEAINSAVQNYTPRPAEDYNLKNVWLALDN
ncbi:MAG: ABC transporter substrate-binding protein [Anaerolineales bacterium]|nr:ABC transporter substrate-binding protein [Anaerolineales bacterium]MCB0005458.1 ABC transporter substrate-binding protein [Anaerolineales bacterium]MCB0019660.1 ABC transporter substrate-binding protein [Anaerolineales bacterium]